MINISMKILNLLSEGKFAKPEYMYHATKLEHLPSILKHGLIPNKEEGGYGSEEQSAVMGYSQYPLSGVYFTRKAQDAVSIAKTFFDEMVIVVCKIQEKTTELDEDQLVHVIDEANLKNKLRMEIGDYDKYERDGFDDRQQQELAEKYTQHVIDTNLNHLHPKMIQHVYKYVFAYVLSLVHFYVNSEIDHDFDDSEVKANQQIMSKQLRALTNDKRLSKTLKVDATIGFSGANKIVGLYDINTRVGWGDLGGLKNYEFHTVKSPQELLYKEQKA
jgi:hypothetical protein